jgi:hypothetical protein
MARVQGKVLLTVRIAPDGRVSQVRAESGHAILKRDAEENAKKWIFGKGSERELQVVYDFRLEPPEVDYIPPTRTTLDLPSQIIVTSHPPITADK